MSARQQRNVQYLLVGGTAGITTGKVSTLNAGEIGIFDAAGTRLTEGTATQGQDFFLALGGTSPLKRTPLIKGSQVKKASSKAFVAATEQEDIIGYNGNAGEIDAIANNLYMIDVYEEEYRTSSHDGRYIKHLQYKSSSSPLASDIALGLTASGIYNWQREAKNTDGDPFMVFKALCGEAGATEANDIDVVKGSKTVEAAGALTAVVGDFLRLGAPGAGATTSSDVYKVTAISGTSYTLDRPAQVATGTYATGTADADIITKAAGNASAEWGVSLKGTEQNHSTGRFFHKKIRFTYILGGTAINDDNFGTTDTTSISKAKDGSGEVNEIKDLEWFTDGANGEFFRMGEPTIHRYTSEVNEAVAGGGYGLLNVATVESTTGSFVANESPFSITLAIPETTPDYADAGTANDITDVLEVIIYGAAGGELAL